MRLEAYSRGGTDKLNIKPEVTGGIINTTSLIRTIYDQRMKISVSDLAFSAHAYLARALAEVAVALAEEEGIQTVGFSGGVAMNEIITTRIRKIVAHAGLQYVGNSIVPPGDGGISLGQAFLSSIR
jgi:hydrogenase maturation protein HypF